MWRRAFFVGLAAGILALVMAVPALAQTSGGVLNDTNGDGVPDIPPGDSGLWDDTEGAATLEDFLSGTGAGGAGFTVDDGSFLVGPCGGIAISYDEDGNSIDMMYDTGGSDPPLDGAGEQAMTSSNPFEVDTRGTVAYYGFTDPAVFYDHDWEVTVQGIGLDSGGDPNAGSHTENAGLVELGEILPFSFTALVKAEGQIYDNFGAGPLFCEGGGWVKFIGPSPFLTPPGILAVLLFAAGFTGLLFNVRPAQTW